MDRTERRPGTGYEIEIGPIGGVTSAFACLALEMHAAAGVEETVATVVEFALHALGCEFAGVALQTAAGPEIPAVTDPAVTKIYRFQLDHPAEADQTAGPMTTCMRDHVPVLVNDTQTDHRWPDWALLVADLGVRSVLNLPLTLSASTVGVLSLYSATPNGFGTEDQAVAEILARHASIAVATARREENLATAVDARKLVGQAMGILMERYDLDDGRAFEVLKRYSQHANRKLRDVAQELIDTRHLPQP
ncbi:GAF and ANTAR domain-containing protein [Kribbella sp. NPDC054772]